jgi:hypothetical protein
VYHEIARVLSAHGFHREQKSVWQRDDVSASFTWDVMMQLRSIRPRGIFATVMRQLEMFYIIYPHVTIVTNMVRLGGILSPTLIGPTPAALAQGLGIAPPPPWPNGQDDELPFSVHQDQSSLNREHWRLPVCAC